MTKSSNHPDADYTIRDMGKPDVYPSKEMWKYHTPEWEGMTEAEKDEWLEKNQDKLIINQRREKLEDVKTDSLL